MEFTNNNNQYQLFNEKEKVHEEQKFFINAYIYLAIQYFIIRVIITLKPFLRIINIYNLEIYIASLPILILFLYLIDKKGLKEDINNIKDHKTVYNCISFFYFYINYYILDSSITI